MRDTKWNRIEDEEERLMHITNREWIEESRWDVCVKWYPHYPSIQNWQPKISSYSIWRKLHPSIQWSNLVEWKIRCILIAFEWFERLTGQIELSVKKWIQDQQKEKLQKFSLIKYFLICAYVRCHACKCMRYARLHAQTNRQTSKQMKTPPLHTHIHFI